MSQKLKSMFKKQISWSVSQEENESSKKQNGSDKNDETTTLRKTNTKRRNRTSLGALEDIIKCPICKQILQSTKMLTCQHTFCKKCLEVIMEENDNGETAIHCPVCSTITKNSEPENLPPNLSIESVLRAVDGKFVETRPDKSQNLFVNFASLTAERRRKTVVKCAKCQTTCEVINHCRHCLQVFCKICQALHVAQLKEQLIKISDKLQDTVNKLEHQVTEFKEKTDNLKETVTKEFDAKIAALHEEKKKKLELIDDFKIKGEKSAEEIRLRILGSQMDFIKQTDSTFDCSIDDNEKIKIFLELHKSATDMVSSALTWQTKIMDTIELNHGDILKFREKDKISNRLPRLIGGLKELERPSGLAMDNHKGDIYVACPGSVQVIIFDRQFRIMRRIQNKHLMAPQAVAFVESLEEIFVTDKWKHSIFVFNRKGDLLRQIGEKGQNQQQFRCPEGIDILQSRDWLYVADTGNDRIQVIGVDSSYKTSIVHDFNQPTDVAVSNNAIVVADSGHHKIKVFNHKNQLMFSFGGFGHFRGFFKSPEVVKLDESNNIIVGDSDNNRVQIFSPQGTFLRTFGIEGSDVGQFGWISGLLCLPNNKILIADSKNNTIQLF